MWCFLTAPVLLERGRIFLADGIKVRSCVTIWRTLNVGLSEVWARSTKCTLFTSILHHELNLQIAVPSLFQGTFFLRSFKNKVQKLRGLLENLLCKPLCCARGQARWMQWFFLAPKSITLWNYCKDLVCYCQLFKRKNLFSVSLYSPCPLWNYTAHWRN